MKTRRFTIAAVQMAAFFWVLESAIHYYVFEEPRFEIVPSVMNEFWMRIVIVFLIVLLGVFADSFVNRIAYRQMQVAHAYNALIQAGGQTLENLLEQMRLFHNEAKNSDDFDPEVLKYFDTAVVQASDLIRRFSNVDKALNDSFSAHDNPTL